MTQELIIGKTKILLENKEYGQGKITVSNINYGEFDMYWGAMGGTLEDFLCRINEHYFTDKLLGHISGQVFAPKGTFREVRKFIREELDLPWYKHMEFQKDLRKKLSYFQERCEEYGSEQYFVEHFCDNLERRLDFHLISDRWERESIEKDFESINEPWHFICTKDSRTTKWLKKLHGQIKEKLV